LSRESEAYWYEWVFHAGSFLKALGKPAAPGVELVVQALYLVPMMVLVGRHSVNHAMLVWATRVALSTPVDMWVQRRWSGMSFSLQLRGAFVPALASLVMGAGVLAVKSAVDHWQPVLRLGAMASVGAAIYALITMVANRDLARQLLALVGKSIQTRG
jgi:teichuronic acid exporter